MTQRDERGGGKFWSKRGRATRGAIYERALITIHKFRNSWALLWSTMAIILPWRLCTTGSDFHRSRCVRIRSRVFCMMRLRTHVWDVFVLWRCTCVMFAFRPFYLTHLLIDELKASAPSRVVILGSRAMYNGQWSCLRFCVRYPTIDFDISTTVPWVQNM